MRMKITGNFCVSAVVALVCWSVALADDNGDGRLGAVVSTGTGGVGIAAKASSNGPRTRGMFDSGSRFSLNLEAGALISSDRKVRPIGNFGWTNIATGGGLFFSDPMLLHSNGTHAFVGGSPLLLSGAGYADSRARLTALPKIFAVTDFRDKSSTTMGMGVQATLEVDITEKLRASAAGIWAPNFYMGKAGLEYKLGKNIAWGASAEVSDLHGVTKDDEAKTPIPEKPAAIQVNSGISAVF